ncbi:MAG: NADH-quinone oxidoreductase subunit NuoI [Nitrospira sp.]|nr:NADH-quinone oxidoreductase subunit NuoI [bacterium]MBL7048511.1 NADH-quinone oxidoreductase subunit NuoI [Nitrospira sp.]
MDLLKKIFLVEILKGMAVTLKQFFTPAVTRQYPKEKREPFIGSRGLHALVRDSNSGKEKCVGCGLCAAMCPSECIHIYTSEGDDNEKVVDRYEIDLLRCVFCGLCVEACPYAALVQTEHFEYSGYTRAEFYYTKDRLLENWDKYMAGDKGRKYIDLFWRPRSSDFEKKSKSEQDRSKA